MRILRLDAREILDSRGFPTVEAYVTLENGVSAKASVPAGASTGSHEAREKRDGGMRLRGKGVLQAVETIKRDIAPLLHGMDARHQREIDGTMCRMDGTRELSNLGANSVLAVSMACAMAAAKACGMELYRYLGGISGGGFVIPMMNVINGGAHAGNNLDIQEFMLVPVGAKTFREAVVMGAEAYHELKSLLKEKGLSTALGDEGGFAPDIEDDEQALSLMEEAIYRAGMMPGKDIAFALDVAASEWARDDGTYHLPKKGIAMDRQGVMEHLAGLAKRHPIISMEDPLMEDDFEGFAAFREMNPGMGIVGDDLFVTDRERVLHGAELKSATAVLIKPNQTGTVTRTMDTIAAAKKRGMDVIVSHRSGETGSEFIADLAWAAGAKYIKAGAPARGERVAKYNRMMEIEMMENMGSDA